VARQVTLADVARAAGVHPATVSRILNRAPDLSIRPETRERVERIAAEQGYRPNAMARGLRLSSAGALGLLVPSLRNPVYAHIIRGAFRRAWEDGLVVLLVEDTGGPETVQAYERLVRERRIDGLLVASARPGSPLLEPGELPTVFVNRRNPAGQSVSMREEDAGALAARHLLELGHTRLAHLAGPADLDTAQRRTLGFTQAAQEGGATVAVVHSEFDETGGYAAMRELLDGAPTAVFVSNLNQAVGALAGARAAGRSVPNELSVVTYDDDPVGEYLDPPLTAVRMPLAELGAAAVECILARMRGGSRDDVVVATAPELVRRASTAELDREGNA
jgi:DNA-binding LacI/PurR family transcriptional regulator